MIGQGIQVAKIGMMFPLYCTIYLIAPTSKLGLFMKKPFVKFICHSASYGFFLSKYCILARCTLFMKELITLNEYGFTFWIFTN